MLFLILVGLVFLAMMIAFAINLHEEGWCIDTVGNTLWVGLVSVLVGFLVFVLVGPIIDRAGMDEGERIETNRVTYTIAENSSFAIADDSLGFVAEVNGEVQPKDIEFENIETVGTNYSKVTVIEYKVEHGTGVFPWGMSSDSTKVIIE